MATRPSELVKEFADSDCTAFVVGEGVQRARPPWLGLPCHARRDGTTASAEPLSVCAGPLRLACSEQRTISVSAIARPPPPACQPGHAYWLGRRRNCGSGHSYRRSGTPIADCKSHAQVANNTVIHHALVAVAAKTPGRRRKGALQKTNRPYTTAVLTKNVICLILCLFLVNIFNMNSNESQCRNQNTSIICISCNWNKIGDYFKGSYKVRQSPIYCRFCFNRCICVHGAIICSKGFLNDFITCNFGKIPDFIPEAVFAVFLYFNSCFFVRSFIYIHFPETPLVDVLAKSGCRRLTDMAGFW